jgi:hypothetical protein
MGERLFRRPGDESPGGEDLNVGIPEEPPKDSSRYSESVV